MPNFFHSPLRKKSPSTWQVLQARSVEEQARNDWPALARTNYALGTQCMDQGDPSRAMLYLGRADTLFSARDAIYTQADEDLMGHCSDRIEQLEQAPTLSNEVLDLVVEKALELQDRQVRQWGLLTLARFVTLGARLSVLPECGPLASMGKVVDLVARSLYEPLSTEDMRSLHAFCDLAYTLSGSESFTDLRSQVEVPGGANLQFFDLNGLLTLTEMNLFLDSHLTLLVEGEGPAEPNFIPCALLPDYHPRTTEGDIRPLPKVRAELKRIWSDCGFVAANPTRMELKARVEAYQRLDILA